MANEIDIDIGTFDLDSGNNIAIEDIQIKVSKAVRVFDLPKADGAIIPIGRRKSISVRIKGSVVGTNYDNLRSNLDSLKSALESTSEYKLTTDDDRYLMVQYRNFAYGYRALRTFSVFSFDLIASDPFWLSETLSSDSRAPTSGVGYSVTNGGNAPTRVKVTVTAGTGLADDIQLENEATGEIFNFRGTVANGDLLVVDNRFDTKDLIVTNNGVSAVVNHEGDFLTLNPGSNTIKYTGGVATVKLEWRDAHY